MARRKSANPHPPHSSSSSSSSSSASKHPKDPITITELPLSLPDRTRKPPSETGHKTLLDLIDDRRVELGLTPDGPPVAPSNLTTKRGEAVRIPPGEALDVGNKDDGHKSATEITTDELFGPGMQTFFYVVPLLTVLFWLDYLVYLQYRQEIAWADITSRCVKGAPAIFIIHYFTHPRRNNPFVQAGLLALSIGCGAFIVQSVNDAGYFAVMKRAPPLGTLWVWSVVEMNLWLDVLSCVLVGAFTWWGGYHIL
ncbi:hypothetical protein EX30DRAFT_393846 [Ascodesmis nigricans]|uniref:DUF7719 domain-containing protein n=1 Tax=Ascodesmis nigricans TaxID=341454 RepID=A0A4S2N553_9PEZI|nr:hypothetical protein EX30DRAFT_393846 [Ascodesmis nigricans]